MSTAELKHKLLELLKVDEEFRLAVAGLIGLGDVLHRLEEHDRKFNDIIERLKEHDKKFYEVLERLEEHDKKFYEALERLDRHGEELIRLREDMNKGFKRHDDVLAKLREDMQKGFELLRRHIDALRARWGLMAEEAFRDGLRDALEEELGLRVERWTGYDDEGLVYGYPSPIEIDVAVKDEKLILVEISSHVRTSDVATFRRKAEVYAKETGRAPDRLLMVTPFVDERALAMAARLGITIYTEV